jgi:hypothetical protein
MLGSVIAAGYLGSVWLPLYFDHYAVKQVVSTSLNEAVKNPDDAALRKLMVQKLAALGQVDGVDAYGAPAKVPAVRVDERAVTWERDVAAKSLHIAFEYEREAVYPFLNRSSVKTFVVDRTGDISLPDWGAAR